MALPFPEVTRATVGLLTRRQGPEDFPYSPALARGLGVAAALTGVLELALQANVLAAVVASLVQVLVIYGLLGYWLRQQALANRLPQTFGALMACTAVLNLAEWPVLAAIAPALRERDVALRGATGLDEVIRILQALPPPPLLPMLGLMVVVVWGVAVKTRLLERALGIGFWRAGWRLTVLLLVASLLGGLAASPFITVDDLPGAPAANAGTARPPGPPAPAQPAPGRPAT